MALKAEIYEQPAVLERLLRAQLDFAREVIDVVRGRGVQSIVIAARGTSDCAAVYAKYLWEPAIGLPVALAAPSLFTLYRTPPRLERSLVVGISQSGQSPDIVGVVEEGRRQGAPTLSITNDPASPVAAAAEMVLDTAAGPELAVAATKSYTAQLTAIALIAAAAEDDARRHGELERVPELVREVLGLDGAIESAAERYRYMDRCVVLGRGFNYATAHEWALKLKEMTYIVAEPYSPADFWHGPVAMVDTGFPVLATAVSGAVLENVLSLLETLVSEYRAELLVLSDEEKALALARTPLRLPAGLPEWLSPIVAIVPAHLFCYHLTRAKGLDTEKPRRLEKVTRTV